MLFTEENCTMKQLHNHSAASDAKTDALPLQARFDAVLDFRGLNYDAVCMRIGAAASETRIRESGQTARTWKDPHYSITLLFNASGLCLGVEEERLEQPTGGPA